MKVVDAGVVFQLVMSDLDIDVVGDDELVAPHLIDVEVLHCARRHVMLGALDHDRAVAGLAGLDLLVIRRHSVTHLRHRIWELRHNLTAYDATYVALAEALRATSLLTSDARIARAPGVRCSVEVL